MASPTEQVAPSGREVRQALERITRGVGGGVRQGSGELVPADAGHQVDGA